MLAQVANVFVALMALLHVYILVLEMFLWKTPFGRKTFGTTAEVAESSATASPGCEGAYPKPKPHFGKAALKSPPAFC